MPPPPGEPEPRRAAVRVLLADDHQMVRDGLRLILQSRPGLEVVGEAADGREAIRLAGERPCDVVLMDITMPNMNGIEATHRIRARDDGPQVIALSMHCDRQFIAEILRAGAAGYLLKSSAASELLAAIETVLAGKVYLSPGAAKAMADPLAAPGDTPPSTAPPAQASAFSALTPREREILQHLAEGASSKAIADSLYLSARTVETYRAQIMDKLNIRTVAGLTKYAVRHGLTTIE